MDGAFIDGVELGRTGQTRWAQQICKPEDSQVFPSRSNRKETVSQAGNASSLRNDLIPTDRVRFSSHILQLDVPEPEGKSCSKTERFVPSKIWTLCIAIRNALIRVSTRDQLINCSNGYRVAGCEAQSNCRTAWRQRRQRLGRKECRASRNQVSIRRHHSCTRQV